MRCLRFEPYEHIVNIPFLSIPPQNDSLLDLVRLWCWLGLAQGVIVSLEQILFVFAERFDLELCVSEIR